MRLVAAVAALWLLSVTTAWAQSDAWLVLPMTVDDDVAWMSRTTREVSRGLRRQGVAVWQEAAAIAAFEARGSSSPVFMSNETVELWSNEAQDGLRLLARGDEEAALARLEEANQLSRALLAELGRDPALGTRVVDTCLYLVRAKLAVGDSAGARAQASECVRRVPTTEPTWRMHPPPVVELYQAAAREAHDRSISVESEPTDCPVMVNGSVRGSTPLEVDGLYPGTYAIQVECGEGERGRVHAVDVTRGSTSLFVFDAFDAAVRTVPVLHLDYDGDPGEARLARDARQFMSTLPASGVVIASRSAEAGVLALSLLTGTSADRVLVRLPMVDGSTDTSTMTRAVALLVAGECSDVTTDPATPIDCNTGEPMVQLPSRPRATKGRTPWVRAPHGQFVAGVTLATGGAASLLAGYGLLIGRRSVGDAWLDDPTSLSRQNRWLALGTGVIVTGSAGGGLLVAAMPLALPHESKTPWWAWLHGGLGVAAAVGSIVSVATAAPKPTTSCSISGPDPQPCVSREQDTNRAIMLGVTAAPLLTVPLVYLLRRDRPDRRAEVSPSVIVARRVGMLTVRGSF